MGPNVLSILLFYYLNEWMNELNLYLKHDKNISVIIENEEVQLEYNFLFTGLHICRVGVRYGEPFISFSLEVA